MAPRLRTLASSRPGTRSTEPAATHVVRRTMTPVPGAAAERVLAPASCAAAATFRSPSSRQPAPGVTSRHRRGGRARSGPPHARSTDRVEDPCSWQPATSIRAQAQTLDAHQRGSGSRTADREPGRCEAAGHDPRHPARDQSSGPPMAAPGADNAGAGARRVDPGGQMVSRRSVPTSCVPSPCRSSRADKLVASTAAAPRGPYGGRDRRSRATTARRVGDGERPHTPLLPGWRSRRTR